MRCSQAVEKVLQLSDRKRSTGMAKPFLTPFAKSKATLRAITLGFSDNSHTCADKSVYRLVEWRDLFIFSLSRETLHNKPQSISAP